MPAKSALSSSQFTQHQSVQNVIRQLKNVYGENFEDLEVSDIIDKDKHQYVHLVQEGGGVLGVALVGYTYVLEQCGIRFLRLAGTSAGAINTMMMSVIGKKEEAKSEKVLDYLCNKNLFDFVDGHPWAKWLIGLFITNKSYVDRMVRRVRLLFRLVAILILVNFVGLGLQYYYPAISQYLLISFIVTGVLVGMTVMVGAFLFYMIKRFKDSGLGINPGNDFLNWMKKILHENGVNSISELKAKAAELPASLQLRPERTDIDGITGLTSDVTFITSDIISQNKVEFPKMWDLFTLDENEIHPAEFVRASMSIPLFFESYQLNDIPNKDPRIINAWQRHLRVEPNCIPEAARFVDGGIISNFPISIFYNPNIAIPRLPTFGIELDDEKPKEKDANPVSTKMSLGTYIYRMFNTVRFYYDKDFLLKNELYKKGIGNIKVFDFNWLNFSISDDEKIRLFVRGAQAAGEFLMGTASTTAFNWNEYKAQRQAVHSRIAPGEAASATVTSPISKTTTATSASPVNP